MSKQQFYKQLPVSRKFYDQLCVRINYAATCTLHLRAKHFIRYITKYIIEGGDKPAELDTDMDCVLFAMLKTEIAQAKARSAAARARRQKRKADATATSEADKATEAKPAANDPTKRVSDVTPTPEAMKAAIKYNLYEPDDLKARAMRCVDWLHGQRRLHGQRWL